MREPKFKVGDKVRVLRASTDEERHLWGDVWWAHGMDIYVGQDYTIKKIECENYQFPSYRLGMFRFPEFVLQKVNDVGEQLMFPFMETSD